MSDFGQFWDYAQEYVLCPLAFLVVVWILYRTLRPGGWMERGRDREDR